MPGCAMFGCKSYNRKTKGSSIRYYRFPKNKELADKWVKACRRADDFNLKNCNLGMGIGTIRYYDDFDFSCICSLHFDEDSFEMSLKYQLLNYLPRNARNLKPDAIPTPATPADVRKQQRCNGLDRRKVKSTVLKQEMDGADITENLPQMHTKVKDITALKNKIKILEKQNDVLRQKLTIMQKSKQNINKEKKNYLKILKRSFNGSQIKALMNPDKTVRWARNDIAAAMSLRNVSVKAYKYLSQNNYPLPALSSLRTSPSLLNGNQDKAANDNKLKKIKSINTNKEKDLQEISKCLPFEVVYCETSDISLQSNL